MTRNGWLTAAPCAAIVALVGGVDAEWRGHRAVIGRSYRAETTVTVLGKPLHPRAATLREELSIGSDDPNAQFHNIQHIAVASDGSIVVGDMEPSIRLFTRDGSFLRRIGRKGSGPGEYEEITAIGILPDGGIAVWDYRQRRVTVFHLNGGMPRSWGLETNAASPSYPMRVNRDGTLTFEVSIRPPGWEPDPSKPHFGAPTGYVRIKADGRVIDTLRKPEFAVKPRTISATKSSPLQIGATTFRSRRNYSLPFAPVGMVEWSPLGYFVSGYSASYAVEVSPPRKFGSSSTAKGDRVLSLRLPHQPVAVSEAERKDWQASLVAFMRGIDPQFNWNAGAIPSQKAAYSRIQIADDGRIWVKVSVPSVFDGSVKIPSTSNRVDAWGRWPAPMIFDVIDPSGVYVGRVRYASKPVFYPFVIRGDQLYTVREDEDRVQSVKRFRVSWNP